MKKRRIIVMIAVMILVMGVVSYYYWFQNKHYVHTEDARVDGNILKVSPQITGRILELPVEEGDDLSKNDLIGRQSDSILPAGSNLELTIIKAPSEGAVLKKIAHVGEIASPSVPVIYMADLNNLYITANIEEDHLRKIKEGQYVEYTIDSVPNIKFTGSVMAVGDAANSVFSLIPQQNTGNSFIKITQRVPIKISIDNYHDQRLLPGMSAVVKIHLK